MATAFRAARARGERRARRRDRALALAVSAALRGDTSRWGRCRALDPHDGPATLTFGRLTIGHRERTATLDGRRVVQLSLPQRRKDPACVAEYTVGASRRGLATFGPVTIRSLDPFAFARTDLVVPALIDVIVLPQIHRLGLSGALAADDPQRIRAYATRTGLAGHTRNSITQLPVLERELGKARQYGIARDNEELELGVRCMAAGIYDDQNRLIAGLSISAPADRLDESWMPKLQAAAHEISAALGHTPASTASS